MYSLAEENYLKGLFHLAAESGDVGVNELSRHLSIKMPTVNSMVKKLSDKGLVHYESYKPLRLTEKGRKEAALIIRKHRLTEMYLVQQMGFGWESVHEIAEQIEHIQAPEFFEKMDELLGYPKADPHGSPIPDRNGKMPSVHHIKLSECRPGDTVKLATVAHSSQDFLKYLTSRELALGITLKISSVEAYDGSMVVSYGKHKVETLSRTVCDSLLVQKL
jgi:DtxR family transcriptional regulator, Mn-dependent transcriptional regulator